MHAPRDPSAACRTLRRASARLLPVAVAALGLFTATAHAGWNKTAAGTYGYLDTANWDGGEIDNLFPGTLTLTAAQTATFNGNHLATNGLTFAYVGNFGLTLRADGVANRTLTLGGDVTVAPASNVTVTIGSTTANQNLLVDLGGAARTVSVASGRALTLVNAISGSGGLSSDGAGTLTLISAGNTFTGGLVVSNGRLAIGSDASMADSVLGSASHGITLANATLQFGTANSRSFAFSPLRPISLSGNVSLVGPNGYSGQYQDVSIPGDIAGSGSLTFQGGITALSGNNTGVSQITLNSLLRVSSEANLGNPASAFAATGFSAKGFSILGTSLSNLSGHTFPWVTNQGITFDIQDPGNTFTWDKSFNIGINAATSTGTFFKHGLGTLVVTASQGYNNVQSAAPDTVVNGGVLTVDATTGGSLPGAADGNQLALSGGTLQLLGKTDAAVSQILQNVKLNAGGGTILVDNHSGSSTTTLTLGDFVTLAPAAGSTLNIATLHPGSGAALAASAQLNDAAGIVGAGRVVYNGADWPTSTSTSAGGTAYNATTDRVTGSHADGTVVVFTTSAPGGTTLNVGYHVVNATGSDFKLSSTLGGPAINLTTTGSGTLVTVGPLGAYAGYTVGLPASGASGSVHYHQTDSAAVSASESAGTLKLTTTQTGQSLSIAADQTLTLTTGGLLFTGAHDYSIAGGMLNSGVATSSDLIVHQQGSGALTIGSTIVNGNGASTLTIGGPGTVVLTGANTYGGPTYVNRAALSISSDANLNGANGTLSPVTSSTASPTVTCSAASLPAGFVLGTTFLGRTVTAIAGSSGSYTITLSGNANATGTNVSRPWANNASLGIYGGTLRVTDNLTLQQTASFTRAVVLGGGGGTFDVATGKTLTIPGSVSGGCLTLANSDGGNGMVVLGGANTFSSGVRIEGGILRLNHASALGSMGYNTLFLGTAATAKLQLNGTSPTVAGLSSASTAAIVENSHASTASTLTVLNGWDNAFAGVLQNGAGGTLAVAKAGCGTLALTGTHTYTGPTTVQGGTLQVDGSLAAASAVTVARGALGGTGTVAGPVTVLAGGALAPGGSVGTLTTGALALNPGAVLDYELGATANADRVAVVGDLTLDGSLSITELAGFGAGQYTLITYTGTLTNNGLDVAQPDNGLTYTIKTHIPGSVILSAAAPGTILFVR